MACEVQMEQEMEDFIEQPVVHAFLTVELAVSRL